LLVSGAGRSTVLQQRTSRALNDQGPVREQFIPRAAMVRLMELTFCHRIVSKCHKLHNVPLRAKFTEFMIQIKRAAF
jgi:hypothetical protein